MHELPPFVFPFVFGAMWVTMLHMLSFTGGWHKLAGRWARPTRPGSRQLSRASFISGSLGWVQYGNCLWYELYPDDLRIGVFFPFRLGHPTLCIPKAEIREMNFSKTWYGYYTVLLDVRGTSLKLLIRSPQELQEWWGQIESPGFTRPRS